MGTLYYAVNVEAKTAFALGKNSFYGVNENADTMSLADRVTANTRTTQTSLAQTRTRSLQPRKPTCRLWSSASRRSKRSSTVISSSLDRDSVRQTLRWVSGCGIDTRPVVNRTTGSRSGTPWKRPILVLVAAVQRLRCLLQTGTSHVLCMSTCSTRVHTGSPSVHTARLPCGGPTLFVASTARPLCASGVLRSTLVLVMRLAPQAHTPPGILRSVSTGGQRLRWTGLASS